MEIEPKPEPAGPRTDRGRAQAAELVRQPAGPSGTGTGQPGRWWPRWAAADAGLPIDPDLDPGDPAEPSRQHRPGPRWPGRYAPVVLAAVFLGGAVGTLGRYAVERALPTPSGTFPVATFVVNTTGALLIGVLMSLVAGRPGWNRRVRPFAGVGVLGGWTTMSTLAVETDLLGRSGAFAGAAGYVCATLVAGVAAVALGIAAGRRWRGVGGGSPARRTVAAAGTGPAAGPGAAALDGAWSAAIAAPGAPTAAPGPPAWSPEGSASHRDLPARGEDGT